MYILLIPATIALLVLAFAYYCYRVCFYSPANRTENLTDPPKGEQYEKWGAKMVEIAQIMDSAAYECVSITAWDGTLLFGRLYAYYPGAPLILAFHGYRSMAQRDCAGAFALAQKMNMNILAVDQRCHGRSHGRTITFGIREREDCLDWVRYASQRFGDECPVILSGISMGASTVLMASSGPLPENVCCILADCPYSSPAGIIRKVAGERGYPTKLAMPVISLGACMFGGFDLYSQSAVNSVKKSNVPILLIHGEDDRFVPCDMSREIFANCNPCAQLHTFPEAGHGLSYIMAPRDYERICVNFLWEQPMLRTHLEKTKFAISIRDNESAFPGILLREGLCNEKENDYRGSSAGSVRTDLSNL